VAYEAIINQKGEGFECNHGGWGGEGEQGLETFVPNPRIAANGGGLRHHRHINLQAGTRKGGSLGGFWGVKIEELLMNQRLDAGTFVEQQQCEGGLYSKVGGWVVEWVGGWVGGWVVGGWVVGG
jgi:hypothetical protein